MKIKKKKNKINILNLINIKPYKKKKNEKYMNINQIKHFKNILILIYKKLILKKKKKIKINFPKPINKIIKEKKIINIIKKKKIINKIKNIIKKIKKKKFGYCNICKKKIGIKILEIKITTKLCINCKINIKLNKKNKK